MRKIKRISKPLVAALVLLSLTDTGKSDVRIKRRTTFKKGGYDSILYLKGKRQREEMNQFSRDGKEFSVAYVEQCDLRRFVWLDVSNKRYALHTGGMPMGAAMAFRASGARKLFLVDKAEHAARPVDRDYHRNRHRRTP